MYAVTQALVPALRRGRGRVVCISSICGRMSSMGVSAYSASKFAVQAMADAWREEVSRAINMWCLTGKSGAAHVPLRQLRPWGVDVVLVEPGAMQTPLLEPFHATDRVEQQYAALTPAQRPFYPLAFLRRHHAAILRALYAMTSPPQCVVDTLLHLVTVRFPRARCGHGRGGACVIMLTAGFPWPGTPSGRTPRWWCRRRTCRRRSRTWCSACWSSKKIAFPGGRVGFNVQFKKTITPARENGCVAAVSRAGGTAGEGGQMRMRSQPFSADRGVHQAKHSGS